jgi:hypothetical protein
MDLLPELQVGMWNGWIPLIIYFIGLILSVSLYSSEARAWLFNNPKDENKNVFMFFRLFGQLAMMAYILLMIFTPIRIEHPVFLAGATVYFIGFVLEIISEKRPPANRLWKDPIVSRATLNGWGYFWHLWDRQSLPGYGFT